MTPKSRLPAPEYHDQCKCYVVDSTQQEVGRTFKTACFDRSPNLRCVRLLLVYRRKLPEKTPCDGRALGAMRRSWP